MAYILWHTYILNLSRHRPEPAIFGSVKFITTLHYMRASNLEAGPLLFLLRSNHYTPGEHHMHYSSVEQNLAAAVCALLVPMVWRVSALCVQGKALSFDARSPF